MLGRPSLHFKPPPMEKHGPFQFPVFQNPKCRDFAFADLLPQNLVPPHQDESALDNSSRRALGERRSGISCGGRFLVGLCIERSMLIQNRTTRPERLATAGLKAPPPLMRAERFVAEKRGAMRVRAGLRR